MSSQVASLLTTDPGRRPTAEQLLVRLNGKRDKVSGRTKPQKPVEQDDDDIECGTLVQSNYLFNVKHDDKMTPIKSSNNNITRKPVEKSMGKKTITLSPEPRKEEQ